MNEGAPSVVWEKQREETQKAINAAKEKMKLQDNVLVVFLPTQTRTGYTIICPRATAIRKGYNFSELKLKNDAPKKSKKK